MSKYRVYFSGYAIVDADSEEEAIENTEDDYFIYEERECTGVEEYFD